MHGRRERFEHKRPSDPVGHAPPAGRVQVILSSRLRDPAVKAMSAVQSVTNWRCINIHLTPEKCSVNHEPLFLIPRYYRLCVGYKKRSVMIKKKKKEDYILVV